MPDYIGSIAVPARPTVSEIVFPITPDYGYGYAEGPDVVVHPFGSGNAKIEQRFKLGTGLRRFRVGRAALTKDELDDLLELWTDTKGGYAPFLYNAPNPDGTATQYTVRFEDAPLSFELIGPLLATAQLVLIEDPDGSVAPTYTLNSTATRFPSSSLETGLLSQVQELIPLLKLTPVGSQCDPVHLSDRRCTIGGQLYLPRLLRFDGISQSISTVSASDEAGFALGNADGVLQDFANSVDLNHAEIQFSLFHVSTGIKLDLWTGNLTSWSFDGIGEFKIQASDGLHELSLPYPCRKASHTCWKDYNDAARAGNCPYTAQGSLDLLGFPEADASWCDRGFESPNGCRAHGMAAYFGGVPTSNERITIKDNSTGVWGFRRQNITSVSITGESIVDQVIPEIYIGDAASKPLTVNAKLAMGREESDFYIALGIVGEGPIGGFGTGHTLDNQLHHGAEKGTSLGLYGSYGQDPTSDPFSLEAGGSFGPGRAAGTAWMAIRRTDKKGYQVSSLAEHEMKVKVSAGLSGWIWTAPGSRYSGTLTNPIWVAVNALIRAKGRKGASAAAQEALFDVQSAIDAAAICDTIVEPLYPRTVKRTVVDAAAYYDEQGNYVPEVTHEEDVEVTEEKQYVFRGVLQEQKALRDWLQEILNNCLGYFTLANGKVKFGIRCNSSAEEAFTAGNILFLSLTCGPVSPRFNKAVGTFGNEDFEYVSDSVDLTDLDHAKLIGGAASPLVIPGEVNLCGATTKSQTARVITTRLREELGGIQLPEWLAARRVSFKTTALALAVEPGMVCSISDPALPGGYGEFRIESWKLNPDYSIEIQAKTTTDSMYDLSIGPKPADVQPDPVPDEATFSPAPNVQAFSAGRYASEAWTQEMYWDSGRQLMLVDFAVLAPITRTNWSGVQIWIKSQKEGDGYNYTAADAIRRTEEFARSSDDVDLSYYGSIGIQLSSVPEAPESWTLIAASLDRQGNLKTDESGNPSGVEIAMVTLAKSDYVQNFTASIAQIETNNEVQWGIPCAWQNAAIPRYTKTRIVLAGYQAEPQILSGENPLSVLASNPGPFTWPPEAVEVTVVCQSMFGDGSVANLDDCPHVHLTIQKPTGSGGGEYTDQVSGITWTPASPEFKINADGQKVQVGTLSWTPPSDDVEYAFGVPYVIRSGVHYKIGEPNRQFCLWVNPDFPAADETVTFYVLAQDKHGNTNCFVEGVTPSLTTTLHAPTRGAQGAEYTSNVTGFSATVSYPAQADGAYRAVVTCPFTGPIDVTWGRLTIKYSIDSGATWSDGITNGRTGPLVFGFNVGTSPVTFLLGAFSQDVNGKENTWKSGTTPTATIIVGNAAGQFDFSRAKATSYDANIFTVTDGKFKIWAFDGSIVTTGTISSTKLNSTEIMVGGGGSKPGKFGVYNASGVQIGFIGVEGDYEGIWAVVGSFGGTCPDDANFQADSGGASIIGSTFSLTRMEDEGTVYEQYYQVMIHSAFQAGFANPHFTGITIRRNAGNYYHRAVHINRGFICFNNAGQQVAALYSYNGDSTGEDNSTEFWGELTLRNASGTIKILLNGSDGEMRTYGHVNILNSAYNAGRLKLGSYQLWVDSSGRLRIKSSDPTTDTDGTIVGTQS